MLFRSVYQSRYGGGVTQNCLNVAVNATPGDILKVQFPANCPELTNLGALQIALNAANVALATNAADLSHDILHDSTKVLSATLNGNVAGKTLLVRVGAHQYTASLTNLFGLQSFPLTNIEDIELGAAGVKKQGIAIKGYISLRFVNTIG